MNPKISIQKKHKKKLTKNIKPVDKKQIEKKKRKQVLDLYLKGKLIRGGNKKIRHKKIRKTNISKI